MSTLTEDSPAVHAQYTPVEGKNVLISAATMPMFQRGDVMAPQAVAEAGYARMKSGVRLIVPGTMNKVVEASRRILPESAQATMNETMLSETEPADRKRERGDMENKASAKARDNS